MNIDVLTWTLYSFHYRASSIFRIYFLHISVLRGIINLTLKNFEELFRCKQQKPNGNVSLLRIWMLIHTFLIKHLYLCSEITCAGNVIVTRLLGPEEYWVLIRYNRLFSCSSTCLRILMLFLTYYLQSIHLCWEWSMCAINFIPKTNKYTLLFHLIQIVVSKNKTKFLS